jgi:hypothetical protein
MPLPRQADAEREKAGAIQDQEVEHGYMAKAKEYASESSLEKAAAKVAKQQVRVLLLPSDPATPMTRACPSIFASWPGLT